MNSILLENYNLHWTLMGGQSFSWDYDPEEDTYYGFTQARGIKLKLKGKTLYWQTYPVKDDIKFLQKYLRLDESYEEIIQKISKDQHISTAINGYPNLRLLSQDFEQTLLSFILSANNNIRSIRRSIRILNRKFGEKVKVDGKEIYLFPKSEVFAGANLEDLLESGIGFRAKYLKRSSQAVMDNDLINQIKDKNEGETRKMLTDLSGVGDKIADCVMVFSLNFDNITPLDVWAKRVFVNLYGLDPKMKYEIMRRWIDDYFEGYAAWAGQFLFEHMRNLRVN